MLVGAHAGGQDLRDVAGRDGGEAVADGAGRRGVPLVGDLAEREHEGEDAALVVGEDALVVAGLYAAERHRGAGGEADRVDLAVDLFAEGDEARVPAQLDALLGELLAERVAVRSEPAMKT